MDEDTYYDARDMILNGDDNWFEAAKLAVGAMKRAQRELPGADIEVQEERAMELLEAYAGTGEEL